MEGVKMKRKFAHNTRLIQELYGNNFNVLSLLNEDKGNKLLGKITGKLKDLKQSIKKGKVPTGDGKYVSFSDAIKMLEKELDEGPGLQRAMQIENISQQLAYVVNNNKEQKSKFDAINDRASKIVDEKTKGLSGSKKQKAKEKAGKVTDKIPNEKAVDIKSKSKNEKISVIQKAIGTNADGKWGPKTNDAWHEWVANNWNKINKLIDSEEKKLSGTNEDMEIKAHELSKAAGFTADLNGVASLAIEIQQSPSSLNEIKTLSGNMFVTKSRGQLYRERYFGRY
jgi:hypothetical protein